MRAEAVFVAGFPPPPLFGRRGARDPLSAYGIGIQTRNYAAPHEAVYVNPTRGQVQYAREQRAGACPEGRDEELRAVGSEAGGRDG